MIKEQGIRIFAVSIGTEKGSPIPIKDQNGRLKEYKKDASGKLVLSKVNKAVLKDFAKWSEGSYYHSSYGSGTARKIREDLDLLEKSLLEEKLKEIKKEHFQFFLILAFILALLELLLGDRKQKEEKA